MGRQFSCLRPLEKRFELLGTIKSCENRERPRFIRNTGLDEAGKNMVLKCAIHRSNLRQSDFANRRAVHSRVLAHQMTPLNPSQRENPLRDYRPDFFASSSVYSICFPERVSTIARVLRTMSFPSSIT